MVTGKLLKIVRELYHISPFRKYFFYRYHYMFSPSQMCFLISCVNQTKDVDGIYFEIGCAEGRTTVFLNKHMQDKGIKKKYICLDTFSGFTNEDMDFEHSKREKDKDVLKIQFVANKKKWVDSTLKMNNINDVETIESDINTFELSDSKFNKIAMCLLDVDLYKPVLSALNKVYDRMQKGGIIIVDDCKQDKYYDGALQAYMEFCKSKSIEPNIVEEKLGIIKF